MLTGLSRRRVGELIARELVHVNGTPVVKPSQRLAAGAVLVVAPVDESRRLEPDPGVEVNVVYQDNEVLVVDKPAGVVVHPGAGNETGTLVHGLLARYPELEGVGTEVGQTERPGVVHRLDRGTSGLLMVARSVEAYHGLVTQLADRRVGRVYRALVVGTVEADSGLVDAPLGRSPSDPTRRAVVADGKTARTRYRVVRRFAEPACTEVECRLETGRTHQIRVHMAAIGHPVVADHRYRSPDLGLGLARPFLHAAELKFEHPRTGRDLEFHSPLPPDLAAALDRLDSPGP